MGTRGPLKKKASANKLAGNPGKRLKSHADAPREAAKVETPLGCPGWLPLAAKAEWAITAPTLKEPLRPEQVPAFAAYCLAFDDLRWAVEELESKGRTYEGPNGAICEHPAAKVKKEAMQRIKMFAAEFGLTPASRARVPEPPQQPEKDALGEFLNRGPQVQ